MRHPDVAVVKSAFTVYQAYRVYWLCDRFAIERSLVLLVNCYDAQLTTKSVAVYKARCAQDFLSLETKKPALGRFFHPNGQRTESLRTGLSSGPIIAQHRAQHKMNSGDQMHG